MKTDVLGIEGMQEYAKVLLSAITVDSTGATVIALSGDLGSGKTTLTQCIARELGIVEHITSPTFVIEKIYTLENQIWERLIHIDAYRLNDPHELEVLGWNEIIKDPKKLIIVEWPERVESLIPETAVHLFLEGSGESRSIQKLS